MRTPRKGEVFFLVDAKIRWFRDGDNALSHSLSMFCGKDHRFVVIVTTYRCNNWYRPYQYQRQFDKLTVVLNFVIPENINLSERNTKGKKGKNESCLLLDERIHEVTTSWK